MTRLREVIHHQETLSDIREIMNAMKNLAVIESRKLEKLLQSQKEIVNDIDAIAADFTDHYPFDVQIDEHHQLYILIGAERGFSGSFNHQLQTYYRHLLQETANSKIVTIAVGRKFATTFDTDAADLSYLEGASAQEEISQVLNQLVNQVETIQQQYGTLPSSVVRHDRNTRGIVTQTLLPPFQDQHRERTPTAFAPQLYLTPQQFLSELIQQYLFAELYNALISSLLAENEYRVSHLQGAIKHLDERNVELGRLRRSLRQEEIIEEIEVILLNTSQGSCNDENDQADTPDAF